MRAMLVCLLVLAGPAWAEEAPEGVNEAFREAAMGLVIGREWEAKHDDARMFETAALDAREQLEKASVPEDEIDALVARFDEYEPKDQDNPWLDEWCPKLRDR